MWALNLRIFYVLYNLSHRNILLDSVAIFFAEYLPYFLVAGFFIFIFLQPGVRRRWYVFCEGALAVILARGIVTEVIRFFYHNPRPFDALGFTALIPESGWSFPSGHMTFFFALALVVWYADRKWGIWYILMSFLMGIARIYVGVHWPLDILGGILIGFLSAFVIHRIFGTTRKELEKQVSQREMI